jgi:hypothetical protein
MRKTMQTMIFMKIAAVMIVWMRMTKKKRRKMNETLLQGVSKEKVWTALSRQIK